MRRDLDLEHLDEVRKVLEREDLRFGFVDLGDNRRDVREARGARDERERPETKDNIDKLRLVLFPRELAIKDADRVVDPFIPV